MDGNEREPRHPVYFSWETGLCSQTPGGCQIMKSAVVQTPWVWGHAQRIKSNWKIFWRFLRNGPNGAYCTVPVQIQSLLCLSDQTGLSLRDCYYCYNKVFPFHNELHCFLRLFWIKNSYFTTGFKEQKMVHLPLNHHISLHKELLLGREVLTYLVNNHKGYSCSEAA